MNGVDDYFYTIESREITRENMSSSMLNECDISVIFIPDESVRKLVCNPLHDFMTDDDKEWPLYMITKIIPETTVKLVRSFAGLDDAKKHLEEIHKLIDDEDAYSYYGFIVKEEIYGKEHIPEGFQRIYAYDGYKWTEKFI